MRTVPLTRGMVARVSNKDFTYLNRWKWYCGANGYAMRDTYANGHRKVVYMHRLVCEHAGRPLSHLCDHRDEDRLNNQRGNLRSATKRENMQNRGPTCRSPSGHKGVYWYTPSAKWCVKIKVNGKNIHLGYFTSLSRAVRIRRVAEHKYFGQFAHKTGRAA